jgi:hypothetical protein
MYKPLFSFKTHITTSSSITQVFKLKVGKFAALSWIVVSRALRIGVVVGFSVVFVVVGGFTVVVVVVGFCVVVDFVVVGNLVVCFETVDLALCCC